MQRANVAQCHREALNDMSDPNSADYVKEAWPGLPQHVRKAIVTLVDAALRIPPMKSDR